MKGSAGSGKSVDTAQFYILRLMQDKGRNLMVMRKTEASNLTSTFAELVSAIARMGVEEYWSITRTPLLLRCVNGNSIIFRGMNDDRAKEKLKSITFESGSLTDIWLEEATEFSRDEVDILDDRLRGQLPEGLFYQIRMTFNPVSIHHWIKRDFFDHPDENVLLHESTYLDNRFVDKAYLERMERRRQYNPEGYRIYGLGEWGESEGLILKNWEVGDFSQDIGDYDSVYMGQDFGFNHADALLLAGFKDGDIYILRELYEKNRHTTELIELAKRKAFPTRPIMYCDSAEPDRIKMWAEAGFRAIPVKKEPGSIGAQIDFLRARKIFIDKSCRNTISEISSWSWQTNELTGELEDEPKSINDDAMAETAGKLQDLVSKKTILHMVEPLTKVSAEDEEMRISEEKQSADCAAKSDATM
ncbi:MAG: PBSX family phage terminase large subunit [Clostridiales bacterium]|nr:PBSX family phage terminase large subunit [Clostridiales bacterium]